MVDQGLKQSGRPGARELRVWDPLVRLIHWSVALSVLINSFSDGEEALHLWVGYIAAGLVGVRLLWGVTGPAHARFSAFPPNPVAAVRHAKGMMKTGNTVHLSHNPLGALMVYNIWLTIAVLGVTGYMMGTNQFFGIDWVEELHEGAYNWLVASIVLHVGGVVFDQWRSGVPLIKAMVTGKKRIPQGWTTK
ncbi:MAG: cytochrome b/b6 domain-containing protein [Brevirhabdus sp.]